MKGVVIDMLLADRSVTDYAELLASSEPAPGGGSAAALAGALGAALTHMVGAFTEGRAKYAEFKEFNAELLERARAARVELLAVVDEDAVAFGAISSAYKMPRGAEAEKAARDGAIQAALKACIEPPRRIMEICADMLELTARAMGKTNGTVTSDLGVAALCLKAAAQGAWLNILVNLKSLKDDAAAKRFRQSGRALLEEAAAAADGVYDAVRRAYDD